MSSKCNECAFYYVKHGTIRGVMDADQDEDMCEYNMEENLMTDGGCYRWEEMDEYE